MLYRKMLIVQLAQVQHHELEHIVKRRSVEVLYGRLHKEFHGFKYQSHVYMPGPN